MRVFILKDTGVQPLSGLFSVRQKGGLPAPPPPPLSIPSQEREKRRGDLWRPCQCQWRDHGGLQSRY